MAQLVSITFDCENPLALAAFWSAVLHRDIADGASEFHAMLRAGPTGSCSRCRRETLVKLEALAVSVLVPPGRPFPGREPSPDPE
jgi:hypothetical protein